MVAAAQFLLLLAFAADGTNTGPLCAVGCLDVIFVAVACDAVYGEKLNAKQWVAILFAVRFFQL